MFGKILVKLNAWRLRHLEKKLEKEIKKRQKQVWVFPERTTWEREQKAFLNAQIEDLIEERSKLLEIDIFRAEYADMHADYLELEEADARLLEEYQELQRKYTYVCASYQDVVLRLQKHEPDFNAEKHSDELAEFYQRKQQEMESDPSLQGKFVFGALPVAEG